MANSKLIDMTEITNPALTDLVYITANPGTTPVDRKSTIDNLKTAMSVPASGAYTQGARVSNTGDITVNATSVALTFDTEQFDTDTIHDTGTNPSRLTCKTAGIYLIYANIAHLGTDAASRIVLYLKLNNTTTIGSAETGVNGQGQALSLVTAYSLSVNDYVECVVYSPSATQHIAGTTAYGNFSPIFGMQRIG
jgi:hypothetical protein